MNTLGKMESVIVKGLTTIFLYIITFYLPLVSKWLSELVALEYHIKTKCFFCFCFTFIEFKIHLLSIIELSKFCQFLYICF